MPMSARLTPEQAREGLKLLNPKLLLFLPDDDLPQIEKGEVMELQAKQSSSPAALARSVSQPRRYWSAKAPR